MKTMNITDFKAHALKVISDIEKFHGTVIVKKRGKAVVEIKPFRPHENKPKPGKLASALISEKDIVSPIDETWETSKWNILDMPKYSTVDRDNIM